EFDPADAPRALAVTRLLERTRGALLLTCRERWRTLQRPLLTFDVRKPNAGEQRALWQSTLGPAAPGLNGKVEALVAQFDLGAPTIRAACAEALERQAFADDQSTDPPEDFGDGLWDACRVQARARLEHLAQRLEPAATWDDLVLPGPQLQTLRAIAVHVRQRSRVYDDWGFATKGARGLG